MLNTSADHQTGFLQFKIYLKHTPVIQKFWLDLAKHKYNEAVDYPSISIGKQQSSYNMNAKCVSNHHPICDVIMIYLNETKPNKKGQKNNTGHLGFVYTRKKVNIEVKQALDRPKESPELVKQLISNNKQASTQERISIIGGTTVSKINIPLAEGKELEFENITVPTDKGIKIPFQKNNVVIKHQNGTEKIIKNSSSTLIGVDYINVNKAEDASQNIVTTLDIADNENEETIQITTLDIKDDEAQTSSQKQDYLKHVVSPKIFNIVFNREVENNADIQTQNFLTLKVDFFLQQHINILAKNKTGIRYCEAKKYAEKIQQCNDKTDCKISQSTEDLSSSTKRHLDFLAALAKEINAIYKTFDVTPIAANFTFVESIYTHSSDHNFPIELNKQKNSSALGPYQFQTKTAKDHTKVVQKVEGTSASIKIYDIKKEQNENGQMIKTFNPADDRAYFIPSTKLAASYANSIFKLFNHRPEYLYLAYHEGETGAARSFACSQQSDKEQCEKKLSSSKRQRNYVLDALQCARKESRLQRRSCFRKIPKHYHFFDSTRFFDNPLSTLSHYNVVNCTTMEALYKFLAISLISMNPTQYGFEINPISVNPRLMNLYNPY